MEFERSGRARPCALSLEARPSRRRRAGRQHSIAGAAASTCALCHRGLRGTTLRSSNSERLSMIGYVTPVPMISPAPPSSTMRCSPRSAANGLGIGAFRLVVGRCRGPRARRHQTPRRQGRDARQRRDGRRSPSTLKRRSRRCTTRRSASAGRTRVLRVALGQFYAAYFRDLDGNKLNFFHFPH